MALYSFAVKTKAEELNNDIIAVKRELRRVASAKCRIKKRRSKNASEELLAILQEEDLLKSVRDYLVGPRKNVATLSQEEVDSLSYDETVKAIKAIQSKKTHTIWLTTSRGDNDEYREACRIEDMLKTHRNALLPNTRNSVRKSDLLAMLNTLKGCTDLSPEDCIARLEQFIKEAE